MSNHGPGHCVCLLIYLIYLGSDKKQSYSTDELVFQEKGKIMAHVFGYPHKDVSRITRRYLFLTVIVQLILTILLEQMTVSLKAAIVSITATIAFCFLMLALVLWRAHPLAWMRIVSPARYKARVRDESSVIDALSSLDENAFIFNGIVLDPFHIEHLVISSKGIFVLAKLRDGSQLHVRNHTLFSNDQPLDKITGSLWRICHRVHIMVKNECRIQIMPQPVLLITMPEAGISLEAFDDINIMDMKGVMNSLSASAPNLLEPQMVRNIATQINSRM